MVQDYKKFLPKIFLCHKKIAGKAFIKKVYKNFLDFLIEKLKRQMDFWYNLKKKFP